MFDINNFCQRRNVTEHTVDAFNDNNRLFRPFTEADHAPFQIVDVIMAETNNLRAAERTGVINTGVAVGIQ